MKGLLVLKKQISKPWLIASEFNAIVYGYKKRGGKEPKTSKTLRFKRFIDDGELVDMEFIGLKFTWKRGRMQKCLDRSLQ